MCPSADCVGGGLGRRTMVSASPFMWEKAIPPVLTLILGNAVLPCMSLVLFELLPHHWSSECMSSCEAKCGHFKVKVWDFRSLLSQPQSLLCFTVRSQGNFSFWHWNLRLEVLMWGWDPSLLREEPPHLSYTF